MILDAKTFLCDDDARERHKFAEFSDDIGALVGIHKGLIFNVLHRDDGILQSAVFRDFDRLQKTLVPIHQFLVWILWTELGIGKLREEEFLLVGLSAVRHFARYCSSRKRGKRGDEERP